MNLNLHMPQVQQVETHIFIYVVDIYFKRVYQDYTQVRQE